MNDISMIQLLFAFQWICSIWLVILVVSFPSLLLSWDFFLNSRPRPRVFFDFHKKTRDCIGVNWEWFQLVWSVKREFSSDFNKQETSFLWIFQPKPKWSPTTTHHSCGNSPETTLLSWSKKPAVAGASTQPTLLEDIPQNTWVRSPEFPWENRDLF